MTARPTPAQTAGPFLSLGLDWALGPCVVDPAVAGAIRIGGTVFDGRGDPVADGLLETWQADGDGRFAEPEERRAGGFRGFGRCLTDADGRWGIVTVKPSPLPASGGGVEAPHLDVALFARGLLDHLVTRIYFADEEAANESDPVLRSLPDGRARATLVAEAADGGYRFDIHLQGPDETLFFRL
ncbi:MAG TPA: protocatechuate 3,4-dioxygenase subunit alpha [Acidimicrobiia bacterium]|nr:protocatechuate 3,4-dioxygenase subunit alpha [Acidimicrobiia bacterium]